MTSGYYSKELQGFATTGFSSARKKILTSRIDCAQARISRLKISVRTRVNTKLTSLMSYDR